MPATPYMPFSGDVKLKKTPMDWARAERARILALLGAQCRICGALTSLTFDCIRPTGHAHHRMSAPQRMVFYRRELAKCNLQVLCASCNSRKGANPMPAYLPTLPTAASFKS